jgi:endonuclease/exonuclease/phosphatase family metal-dependent hydrolase
VADLVVASWNVHSGVDGWGRPFDVVDGCRTLDADVIFLQETWGYEGETSNARQVADALGYQVKETPIGPGIMLAPPASSDLQRWGPPPWVTTRHGPRVDGKAIAKRGLSASEQTSLRRGTIGLSVLTRVEIAGSDCWDLGRLRGDPTTRSALAVEVVRETGTSVLFVGTHLSHLRHGSPVQVARLHREISRHSSDHEATVLAGDMNLPRPAMKVAFPRWRVVVRGRSWPSWRPLVQPDHVLVRGQVNAHGEVLALGRSDHFPVRAELSFG